MLAKTCMIVGLGISLAGCALFERKTEIVVVDSSCAVFAPIRLLKAEVGALSEESVNQILTHNRIGQQRCGWLPRE